MNRRFLLRLGLIAVFIRRSMYRKFLLGLGLIAVIVAGFAVGIQYPELISKETIEAFFTDLGMNRFVSSNIVKPNLC